MDIPSERHVRTLSARQIYLDSLKPPSPAEGHRITAIQLQKEEEIDSKYHSHTQEEHNAATMIQAAYRGHRDRRQLDGLTLDPSSRWLELLNEMKIRSVTSPDRDTRAGAADGRDHSPSDTAKRHWRKVGWVAGHAGRGESLSFSRSGSAASNASSQRSNLSDSASTRSDTMLMDLRYFLEMVDQKHRYGANLQIYHEFWQREHTKQNFFQWLDHGRGRFLNLRMCSRAKLDSERIRYLSREERKDYLVQVDDEGRLRWAKNDELITTSIESFKDSANGIVPIDAPAPDRVEDDDQDNQPVDSPIEEQNDSSLSPSGLSSEGESATHETQGGKPSRKRFRVSPATVLNHLLRASVKPGTWIYVADTVGRLYVSIKSSGAFQHASFLSGARISSAGSIGVQDGRLAYISPLSGHYRPTTKSFRDFLANLDEQGVDMSHLKVSGAYKVLKGMEVYGKTKQSWGKIRHPRNRAERPKAKRAPGSKEQKVLGVVHEADGVSATGMVQRSWEEEHTPKS